MNSIMIVVGINNRTNRTFGRRNKTEQPPEPTICSGMDITILCNLYVCTRKGLTNGVEFNWLGFITFLFCMAEGRDWIWMIRATDKCPLQILLLSIELFLYSIYYNFIFVTNQKTLVFNVRLIKSDRKYVEGIIFCEKGCFHFMTGCLKNFINFLLCDKVIWGDVYGTGLIEELRFVIFDLNWIQIDN